MHVCVLGSSSAGNCTVFWEERRALLVDCGFSQRYISRHLRPLGLTLREVEGVVITHAHADHVLPQTLVGLLALRIPIYAPPSILQVLAEQYRDVRKLQGTPLLRPMRTADTGIGPFLVTAFPVPHDAAGGCFSYAVQLDTLAGSVKATIATDLGYVPDGLVAHCANSHILVVESNHDLTMLAESRRPEWLKDRIRTIGHLSNDQSGQLVRDILRASSFYPEAVMLAHVSKDCNTNERAVASMALALQDHGAADIRVLETFRHEPNEAVSCLRRANS
jgi:phosphoribosyl 1,2-cyclic phosphodiesterase